MGNARKWRNKTQLPTDATRRKHKQLKLALTSLYFKPLWKVSGLNSLNRSKQSQVPMSDVTILLSGVTLSSLGTATTAGLFYHPQVVWVWSSRWNRWTYPAKWYMLLHSGGVGIHIFPRWPASCFDQGISFVSLLSLLFSSPPFFFFHASSTFISSCSFPIASLYAALSYSFLFPSSHSFLQRFLIFCFFLSYYFSYPNLISWLTVLICVLVLIFFFIFPSLRFSTSSLS